MQIILASSSPYRKELLNKLNLPFTCLSPQIEEEKLTAQLQAQNASAEMVAERLSRAKAEAIQRQTANLKTVIIAGDQLLSFQDRIFNKPLTYQTALQQLTELNGQEHRLITSVTVVAPHQTWHLNHITRLKMKSLKESEIRAYLTLDQPLDCAGSYKIEKHGLVLFEHIECDDFSAIQGLPMIWLSNRLKETGYELFKGST